LKQMMIRAVDKHHVGIMQRLRGRQSSETTPDNNDLFVRHKGTLDRLCF
jgi:hypothetical protein